MKKTLPNLRLMVVPSFVVLLVSCMPMPSVNQEDALQDIASAAQEERIQIPLDETIPGVSANLTKNLYLIFDGSGSMRERPGADCAGDKSFPSKIEGAKWAVREFISKVPEGVNLGLYVFDNNGDREVVPLGSKNQQKLLEEVDKISADGGTPLAEAVIHGVGRLVEQYKKQLGYGEYRLVVITDGQANGIREASLETIRYGFPIYAIGLCIGEDHPLRHYALSYRAADSMKDLQSGLEETLAELPTFDISDFEVVGQ